MPSPDIIEVEGLTKSFDHHDVLRGVGLYVRQGTVHALLGSNGAGKTTLVRILATLLRPDGGHASVGGLDVVRDAERVRRGISLTGQFAAVDGILTGRENLALVARLRRVAGPARVATELLERFDLTAAGDRRAATYSGGMRRRLDIAMSLVGDAPVIFLDEPTTGLDPQARQEVWQVVRELADDGRTILLTTQYLEEAEQLADRVSILHGGRIIADGTVEDLRAMLPPTETVYVEKQPSLEEIFLALVGRSTTERGA